MTIRVLGLLVVMACNGSATGPSTAGSGSGAPPPPPPVTDAGGASAARSCRTAADCTIGCIANADDCCGDICGCEHPYSKTGLAAVTAAQRASCAGKKVDCPVAKCVIQHYRPGCNAGQCVALEAAESARCKSDQECVVSDWRDDGECCVGCGHVAWHVKDLADHQAWVGAQCGANACRRNCPVAPAQVARCDLKTERCVLAPAP